MNAKKQVLAIASVILIFFSSCQKDVVNPEEKSVVQNEILSTTVLPNDVPETAPPIHTPINLNINSNVGGYYETLPARYNLTTKKYPLILFIHGIGELGIGVTRLNCCGIPHWASLKQFPAEFIVGGVHYSFIVISPQFKTRPNAANIQSIIDFAKTKYRVDVTRIYVTGLSMGGGSTWDYSAVYGQNAAAIVPVCAGTRPTTALAAAVASKNLPSWTIHSTGDAVVPVQWAKDWTSWIKADNAAIAPNTKLSLFTTETHNDTWFKTFNPTTKFAGINIYEWMLQFKRNGTSVPPPPPPPPPVTGNTPPVASAGVDQTVPVFWHYLRINANGSKDPDGWLVSLKWTKVSGPTSYSFANANAGNTLVNNLVAGVYVFRVTATDNKGATDTDDVTITMQ